MGHKKMDNNGNHEGPFDVMLKFESRENFMAFCDLMGVSADSEVISGEDFLKIME